MTEQLTQKTFKLNGKLYEDFKDKVNSEGMKLQFVFDKLLKKFIKEGRSCIDE